MENYNLFVYGTLKKGFGNNSIIRYAEFVGDAVSINRFDISDCGFPCAYLNPDGKLLQGEVYKLKEHDFIYTDRLESNGSLYLREIKNFKCYLEIIKGWIYIIIEPFGVLYKTNSDVINWG